MEITLEMGEDLKEFKANSRWLILLKDCGRFRQLGGKFLMEVCLVSIGKDDVRGLVGLSVRFVSDCISKGRI